MKAKRIAQLYEIQKDFIAKASKIIKTGKIGVFSSPTGTGKTLSLLHSLKSLLTEKNKDEVAESALLEELFGSDREMKIFYVSRTHSQLSQVIHELKNVCECKAIVLGSRKLYCINEKINKADTKTINSKCKSAIKNDECLFYTNLSRKIFQDDNISNINLKTSLYSENFMQRQPKSTQTEKNQPKHPQESQKPLKVKNMSSFPTKIHDIEDFISECKACNLCPYYLSKTYADKCDILFMPYHLLFSKDGRESLNITLDDSVVIVDEAHNLIETIVQINTVQISKNSLKNFKSASENYLLTYENRLNDDSRVKISKLIEILETLIDFMIFKSESSKTTRTKRFDLANKQKKPHIYKPDKIPLSKIQYGNLPNLHDKGIISTEFEKDFELTKHQKDKNTFEHLNSKIKSSSCRVSNNRNHHTSNETLHPKLKFSEKKFFEPIKNNREAPTNNRSSSGSKGEILLKLEKPKMFHNHEKEPVLPISTGMDSEIIHMTMDQSTIQTPETDDNTEKDPISPKSVENKLFPKCFLEGQENSLDKPKTRSGFQKASEFISKSPLYEKEDANSQGFPSCYSISSSEFLVETGLYNYRIPEIVDFCKRNKFFYRTQTDESISDFFDFLRFLVLINESDAGGLIFYYENCLKFTPLDVQMYFEDILKCKSLILAGGTMEPIDDLVRVLFRENFNDLSSSTSDTIDEEDPISFGKNKISNTNIIESSFEGKKSHYSLTEQSFVDKNQIKLNSFTPTRILNSDSLVFCKDMSKHPISRSFQMSYRILGTSNQENDSTSLDSDDLSHFFDDNVENQQKTLSKSEIKSQNSNQKNSAFGKHTCSHYKDLNRKKEVISDSGHIIDTNINKQVDPAFRTSSSPNNYCNYKSESIDCLYQQPRGDVGHKPRRFSKFQNTQQNYKVGSDASKKHPLRSFDLENKGLSSISPQLYENSKKSLFTDSQNFKRANIDQTVKFFSNKDHYEPLKSVKSSKNLDHESYNLIDSKKNMNPSKDLQQSKKQLLRENKNRVVDTSSLEINENFTENRVGELVSLGKYSNKHPTEDIYLNCLSNSVTLPVVSDKEHFVRSEVFHQGSLEYHSYDHVCTTFQAHIVASGYSSQLYLTHKSRSDNNIINEYLVTLKGYVNSVQTGGIVCFVPSGIYIDIFKQHMLEELKNYVLYDIPFSEYRKLLETNRVVVLFSVMGGRLSEGVNFRDDLCRLLLVFGVPYPTQNSELFLREKFYKIAGIDYQTCIAMKRVNQAVGRAIRHKNDYAVVVLLDSRYRELCKHLSPWIRSSAQVCTLNESQQKVKTFLLQNSNPISP